MSLPVDFSKLKNRLGVPGRLVGGGVDLPKRIARPLPRFGITRAQREAIRTNLWSVPALMVAAIVVVFVATYEMDLAAADHRLTFPSWVNFGGPDSSRQILIAIAAAVITVAGVVFSITILALQLASQQFGPRMLRNFIRDLGTQISLGAFVATFVYSNLGLIGVTNQFVPHLSITVAVGLLLADLGVLIYFIDHVATSIQLTSVVWGIARDFRRTLSNVQADAARMQVQPENDREDISLLADHVLQHGAPVPARESGFLQAVGHQNLLTIATSSGAVIRLIHRPGHFVVTNQPLGYVLPREAVRAVSDALARAHIVGPNRTLTQDPGFAIDQLVEVAIRALSPAVNDTFTALNCVDWLGDCLCRACAAPLPSGIYQDAQGAVRLIEPAVTHERLLKGATDKVRQASLGMPAILIRMLENLRKVMGVVQTPAERELVRHHAEMIVRSAEESVSEPADLADIRSAHKALLETTTLIWQG